MSTAKPLSEHLAGPGPFSTLLALLAGIPADDPRVQRPIGDDEQPVSAP